MSKKVIFTIVFIISLSGIGIASLQDWIFLSIFIHVIWLSITGNETLRLKKNSRKIERNFQMFNQILIYVLIADIFIIWLSMSFGFRLIFASFYLPTFALSAIGILCSILGNYFVILNSLRIDDITPSRKLILVMSTFCYPIGVYTISDRLAKLRKNGC